MGQVDDYAPEYGEDPEEYLAMRAAEDGAVITARELDEPSRAKAKLTTVTLKWVCAAMPKERVTRFGNRIQYFTQVLFTARGNRLVLTYDSGTLPLTAGPGRFELVEVFGRMIEEEPNSDKTVTVFICGAEVFKTGSREATQQAATRPVVIPAPRPPIPKLDAAVRERANRLRILRAEVMYLRQVVAGDDSHELKVRLLERTLELAVLEGRASAAPPSPQPAERASSAGEHELRALFAEQIADDAADSRSLIERMIEDAERDVDDPDDTDVDQDGAEREASTIHGMELASEPWADSSLPLGSTVDPECWDCPYRLGASCTRASGCIFA